MNKYTNIIFFLYVYITISAQVLNLRQGKSILSKAKNTFVLQCVFFFYELVCHNYCFKIVIVVRNIHPVPIINVIQYWCIIKIIIFSKHKENWIFMKLILKTLKNKITSNSKMSITIIIYFDLKALVSKIYQTFFVKVLKSSFLLIFVRTYINKNSRQYFLEPTQATAFLATFLTWLFHTTIIT